MAYYGQPVAVAPMPQTQVIVQTQPIMQPGAMHVVMERDWTTGLCGCCEDCGVCCAAFFCPYFYICYAATEMRENCCVGLCTPGALIALRTKIRTKEHIRGGICNDTCLDLCCHPCALAQMGREVKVVKQRQGGYF